MIVPQPAMTAPFELLLMRHGLAEDYAEGGDAQRPLTPAGTEQVAHVGRALRRLDLAPDGALCSPLLRARQTLAAVLQGAECSLEAQPTEGHLIPSADPAATIVALAGYAAALSSPRTIPRLLAVGHNPSVTATLGQLVCDDPGVHFSVAPGDVAHLHIEPRPVGVRAFLLGFFPAAAIERLYMDRPHTAP